MLLEIHEVSLAKLEETNWDELGYGHLSQVFFSISDGLADYGTSERETNTRGNATFFEAEYGEQHAVILLPTRVPGSNDARDLQFALKVGALVHEIGHVVDAEQSLNIRIKERQFDVIDAEIFANVYALNYLAEQTMGQSYNMLFEAIEKVNEQEGYMREVGRGVLAVHPRAAIPNWNDFVDEATELALKQPTLLAG